MGRVQDAMRRASGKISEANEPAAGTEVAGAAFPGEATMELPLRDTESADEAELEFASEAAVESGQAPDPAEPQDPDADLTSHLRSARLSAKIVVDEAMMPSSREQYRRLAASLHHAQEATGLKVVMIASAVAGEGKSLTAANLALTFSESYQRTVLLIDGDLRRPALHKLFGVEADAGLSEALMARDEPSLTMYDLSDRLTLLPAGNPTSNPMAGLTSIRMRALLEEARERFDWVIIDTPPIGVLTDANLLGAMVDGALLVIRAASTPHHLVSRAADAIGRDRLLGAVLNRVTERSPSNYYQYYSYYHAPRAQEGG